MLGMLCASKQREERLQQLGGTTTPIMHGLATTTTNNDNNNKSVNSNWGPKVTKAFAENINLKPISTQEKFPLTANFPKI